MSISTLANTQWDFSNLQSVPASLGQFSLTGILEYQHYNTELKEVLGYPTGLTTNIHLGYKGTISTADTISFYTNKWVSFSTPLPVGIVSLKLRVTGGDDVQDETLINWFEENLIQEYLPTTRKRGVLILNDATGAVNFTLTATGVAQLETPVTTLGSDYTTLYIRDNNASTEHFQIYVGERSRVVIPKASGGVTSVTNNASKCPGLSYSNTAGVKYSMDGGSTWTRLGNPGLTTLTTDLLPEDTTQLLVAPINSSSTGEVRGYHSNLTTSDLLATPAGTQFDLTPYLGSYLTFGVRYNT